MAAWLFLKLHFHRADGGAIGPGRVAIMEAIDRLGSLTAAAEALDLTYRQVWNVVQTINAQFDGLVEVKRGRHGGGASLTPKAQELVQIFRCMEHKFYDVFADDLAALEKLLGEDPHSPMPIPRDVQIIVPERARPRPPGEGTKATTARTPSRRAGAAAAQTTGTPATASKVNAKEKRAKTEPKTEQTKVKRTRETAPDGTPSRPTEMPTPPVSSAPSRTRRRSAKPRS